MATDIVHQGRKAANEARFVDKICPDCMRTRQEKEFPSTPFNSDLEKVYSALNTEANEIRRLTVFSGSLDNQIQCALDAVSLNVNPSYKALSYCWGDPDARTKITVNGQEVSVTKSLYCALRYLRKVDEDVVIWADAICINQQDTAEKSVQVRMMGEIYAKASEVLIWLGECEDNSDMAMDYIESINTINFNDPDYKSPPLVWSAIRKLWQRPWFGRVWTVQEAFLAQKATMICGHRFVDLQRFVDLKQVQMEHMKVPEERLRPMQSGLTSPMGLALWDWSRLKTMLANGGVPLFQMLTTTGQAQCFLPVDKIFGLLSMCTETERLLIKVDYRCCTRCVVLRVATYELRRRVDFSPLSVLQTHQTHKMADLPSWAPDYTKDDDESHFMFPAAEGCIPYRAGADNAAWTSLGLAPVSNMNNSLSSLDIRFEDDGSHETLIVPGLMVDMIRAVFPTPFIDFYTGPDLVEDARIKGIRKDAIINACKEWECVVRNDLSRDFDPYKETCGRYEAFWRTLIADQNSEWPIQSPVSTDFAARFEAWIGRGNRVNDKPFFWPYNRAAIMTCLYRSFIITERGYLGLVPRHTMPGQYVCVLRGGNVPFVLNRREDGYWDLVGESYVHGIMDGSVVRMAKNEDLREIRIR